MKNCDQHELAEFTLGLEVLCSFRKWQWMRLSADVKKWFLIVVDGGHEIETKFQYFGIGIVGSRHIYIVETSTLPMKAI